MASSRSILLTGSLPLRPAGNVFAAVSEHIGDLVPCIPDGEQNGWIEVILANHAKNEAMEVCQTIKVSALGGNERIIYRMKPGLKVGRDLKMGPFGYAENAINSYKQFKALKDAGKIPSSVRFQVTIPGPGMHIYMLQMLPLEVLPVARAAIWSEVREICDAIPHEDLLIHMDIVQESEHEEYIRRPWAFDMPIESLVHWTHDEIMDSVAWIVNQVPFDVGLGFHICSCWHLGRQPAGQDNNVLVDSINLITKKAIRPIDYFHMPIIPLHDKPSDFEPLRGLRLQPNTKLFLGVLDLLSDGFEGAKKRIALAENVVSDFGIAHYCGLGRANSSAAAPGAQRSGGGLRATADTIGEVLDLHRRIADLN